jgi:hypothetical protein
MLHLANSDGCNWIGPSLIHRRAPLTCIPTPGTRTARHATTAKPRHHTTGDFQIDRPGRTMAA